MRTLQTIDALLLLSHLRFPSLGLAPSKNESDYQCTDASHHEYIDDQLELYAEKEHQDDADRNGEDETCEQVDKHCVASPRVADA